MALMSKISPPGSSGIVSRERVFRLLDDCLKRPAVWISSPAGSGKTSLVAGYLEDRQIPALWYKADDGDGDIATFFYYMGLAAKRAAPRCRKPLPLLTPEYLMGIPAFARRYFESLYRKLKPPFAIVLDDYQEILLDSPFHEVMNIGLSFAPQGINIIVLSRTTAPDSYARQLANNRISRLGWEEVRLTEEESKEIARAKCGMELTDGMLSLLHEKTQGWVAGLVLLMESSGYRFPDHQTPAGFTPGEIFAYFAAEIFRKTERKERDFLVATAFLPSITVRTAEALTGNKAAGRILRGLNERNYFTERHLKDHSVYLYHPLFREFLLSTARETLAQEEIAAIQRKAAALLIEEGQAEDAASLLVEARDWNGLVPLVLGQAPSLMSLGRSGTLEEWLGRMPPKIWENIPWLLYWKGLCILPLDPAGSRGYLERAHRLFMDAGDDAGALLSWVGSVDACFCEFDDFRPLDELIDWLDDWNCRGLSYPAPEIEASVAVGMSWALLWRRPDHPRIGEWMSRASLLSGKSANPILHVNAPISAVTYNTWMGETSENRIVLDRIKRIVASGSTPPLVGIAMKFVESHCLMHQAGEYDRALHSASEGLAMAEDTGVHLLDSLLYSQMAFGALISGNRALTEKYLKSMEASMGPGRRGTWAIYYTILCLHSLNLGNVPDAAAYSDKALSITVETGVPFPEAMGRVLAAQVSFEAGDHGEATRQLARAEEMFSRIGSACFEYTCALVNAYFAPALGREREGLDALRRGLSLAKKKGYNHAPYLWRREVMGRLCVKALESGIEVEYVRTVIGKLNLVPDEPPVHLDNWPWPIVIRSLGGFQVWKDGKPLEFPVKAPRKIISFLRFLVACGGNGAGDERLADMLWPDADGDAALQALATSIHRLRQLLGDDKAVQRRDGRVKLDVAYCRVDAHAFEELLDRAENGPKSLTPWDCTPAQLLEKALLLYKGEFLGESVESWALSYRERLREKYLRAVGRLGRLYEDEGRFDKAVECYQKGLETDNLAEEFYCRIMKCRHSAGRRAEAAAVYAKCKRILGTVLGVNPSRETEELYERILSEE